MQALLFRNWRILLLSLVTCFSYYWLAYCLDRTNFLDVVICFGVSFGVYFYSVRKADMSSLLLLTGTGILFRFIFITSIPTLSDDYFRFIWDGQLIASGINPFDFLPTEVSIDFPNKAELLAGMNSPEYYTVYPPIAQFVYYLSVYFSPNSILGSIIFLRIIILLCEIGTILILPKLLRLLNINPINSLWYSLNPLVIIELTGNLHFEGIVIFFFLIAVYLLVLQKEKLSAVAWAFAAATKLIPIFFLPIILRKFPLKKSFLFYLLFGIIFIALWAPFYNSTLIPHFLESVRLYSKTFEFNASIYYIVRWVGYKTVGYNIIQTAGPWLARIAYLGILVILLKKKIVEWKSFFVLLLFAISWYYLFALIVHPWYSVTLVFLAVFTRFRYPMLWSAMAVLSYWAYSNPYYQENFWLLAVEYVLVIGMAVGEFLRLPSILRCHTS